MYTRTRNIFHCYMLNTGFFVHLQFLIFFCYKCAQVGKIVCFGYKTNLCIHCSTFINSSHTKFISRFVHYRGWNYILTLKNTQNVNVIRDSYNTNSGWIFCFRYYNRKFNLQKFAQPNLFGAQQQLTHSGSVGLCCAINTLTFCTSQALILITFQHNWH